MAKPEIGQKHWAVVLLLALVAVVLLVSLTLYQVPTSESAVVRRFGQPLTGRDTSPGLHFRWPWPIEDVWRVDNRLHVFEGKTGEIEETLTQDHMNILVTLSVCWRVDAQQVVTFMNKVETREIAEERLTALLKNAKHGVMGNVNFRDLVAVSDPAAGAAPVAPKLREVERLVAEQVRQEAAGYGIEVTQVFFRHLGLPENVTTAVSSRMKEERLKAAKAITAEGQAEADKIRAGADRERQEVLAKAQQEAVQIRAEGDKLAAESYKAFTDYPELANFLRQLRALQTSLKGKTTLVLDTSKPPFSLFQKETLELLEKESKKLVNP